MSDFQRARQPEQKQERRALLLATARAMLNESADSASLSLNDLARRAQMAKSNVYRYFESREAVLLALLEEEWTHWFDDLREAGARGASRVTLKEVVHEVCRTLASRRLLCHLTSVLPSVLEHNLSEQAVKDFKLGTLAFFAQLSEYLARRCPVLDQAAYTTLVGDSVTLITGLYAFTHPSVVVQRVLEAPELAAFRADFASELERLMLSLAEGLHRADDA
jgi:AcrR family transcriptional regulator